MDTRQLTSLLFFNSTQRRNADQEIANLADKNKQFGQEKHQGDAKYVWSYQIRAIKNPDDLQHSPRDDVGKIGNRV
jgi:hypothetical protein